MTLNIEFRPGWFFTPDLSHAFAVSELIRLCRQQYGPGFSVLANDLNTCRIRVPYENYEEAASEIKTIIDREIAENVAVITPVADEAPQEPAAPDAAPDGAELTALAPRSPAEDPALRPAHAHAQPRTPAGDVSPLPEDVWPLIDTLVGAQPFREECARLHELLPAVLAAGTQEIFYSAVYLFAGSTGCGYTHALTLLTGLLQQEGLFSEYKAPEEMTLPAPGSDKYEEKLDRFFAVLDNALQYSSDRVLSLDLSEQPALTDSAAFRRLMAVLRQAPRRNLLVFRIPNDDREKSDRARSDIGALFPVTFIPFPAFDEAGLRELVIRRLEEYDYTVADDALPALQRLVSRELAAPGFCGVRSAEKLAAMLILQAQRAHASILTADLADPLAPASSPGSLPALDELAALPGMKPVADQLRGILRQISYARSHGLPVPAMHMCFTGAPGTGKTTAARLLGRALKDSGILRVGKFFEHHGRDFTGKYVGHTAPQTIELCREAYGSVLFIDEAYTLYNESERDYGREALDTLIAQMENHREDLVVIFAGYGEDMDRLLDSNAGLRSRVKNYVNFPSYDRDTLCEIFLHMSRETFRYSPEYEARAREHFASLPQGLTKSREFGNGRYCRNLYELAWGHAVSRAPDTAPADMLLQPEDLDDALSQIGPEGKPARTIGFM